MKSQYDVDNIKQAIITYFSDDLQSDETPKGAQERDALQTLLTNWAKGTHMVRSIMNGKMVEEAIDTPYGCSVRDEAYWCN